MKYFKYRADDLRSRLLMSTSILTHHGETGSNLEFAVRDFLGEYLPGNFGIESGFVRSLDDLSWQSRQIDVLLTRKDIGQALAVLPGSKVFPIEALVGFMEVTQTLNKKKLAKDFEKVRDLKQKARRTYIVPYTFAKAMGLPVDKTINEAGHNTRLLKVEYAIEDLEPRFFYFAFSSQWKKTEVICKNLKEMGARLGVHCHGLFILDRGYFLHQPYGDYRVLYRTDLPDAFVLFLNNIIEALNSFTVVPSVATIPIARYASVEERYEEYNG